MLKYVEKAQSRFESFLRTLQRECLMKRLKDGENAEFPTIGSRNGQPCNEAVERIDYEKAHGRQRLRAGLISEILSNCMGQLTLVFYMGNPQWSAHASPRRPTGKVVL